jgi:hypothetical protein
MRGIRINQNIAALDLHIPVKFLPELSFKNLWERRTLPRSTGKDCMRARKCLQAACYDLLCLCDPAQANTLEQPCPIWFIRWDNRQALFVDS